MKALFLTNEYPPHIYGGAGVHVPYHLTWALEHAEVDGAHPRLVRVDAITEVPAAIDGLSG